MIALHNQWLAAKIQLRKAHEDSIRVLTLSAHDQNDGARDYQRLALASLKAAAEALGFNLVPIADDSKAKGAVEALAREVS